MSMAGIQQFITRRDLTGRMAAWHGTLYYVEILYLAMVLQLYYGRTTAMLIGVPTGLYWTAHLFALYLDYRWPRRIHLPIITIHAAYAVALFAVTLWQGLFSSPLHTSFTLLRFITALLALAPILALTSER